MSDLPRLNKVISVLVDNKPAFLTFAPPNIDTAIAMSDSPYDGVVFEMEHHPYDIGTLRDCLQYMLSRRQIFCATSLAPTVTPFVRLPANGAERNVWLAKQALDIGVYGIIWPQISTIDDARNAVSACRYRHPRDTPYDDPPGKRGYGPKAALRYWGISDQDYRKRADVWPLVPDGDLLVIIMIEEKCAIDSLPAMLEKVPGIGVVLIGETDLSVDLGYPRQYDHPTMKSAMTDILAICKQYEVPCGHPHANTKNIERLIQQGFRWFMASSETKFETVEIGLHVAGRL